MAKFIPVYKCRRCDTIFKGDMIEHKNIAITQIEHVENCEPANQHYPEKYYSGCADLVGFDLVVEGVLETPDE